MATFAEIYGDLNIGARIQRTGWAGKGLWVRKIDLYTDKEFRVMERVSSIGTFMPFYVIYNPADGKLNTWVPSISDIQADDWLIVHV